MVTIKKSAFLKIPTLCFVHFFCAFFCLKLSARFLFWTFQKCPFSIFGINFWKKNVVKNVVPFFMFKLNFLMPKKI